MAGCKGATAEGHLLKTVKMEGLQEGPYALDGPSIMNAKSTSGNGSKV